MIEYIYWDFNNIPISIKEYKEFLYEYYGDSASERYERLKWYRERGDYHLLLALYDGKPVGQSAAYKVTAWLAGREENWWWGVDAFVFSRVRGKGIGKGLQKRLHNDYENFSSMWYSRTNGYIKRACGANEFLLANFNFYPVSSFFSIMYKILMNRCFDKDVSIRIVCKKKYYILNRLFLNSKKYIAREINLKNNLKDAIPYIKGVLEKYDFFIKRDYDYMYWKYINNPMLKNYYTLFIYSTEGMNCILGIVIFSGIFEKKIFSVPMKVVTILDCFISDEKKISMRSLLIEVIKFYDKRGMLFDGVLTMQNISYLPCLRYPYRGTPLLSTCKNEPHYPYLSYSDQDMEQMIL